MSDEWLRRPYSSLSTHHSSLVSPHIASDARRPASELSVLVPYPILIIIRRGRIELPPFLIPASLFVSDFQLLVVAVGDAHGPADVVHFALSRNRHAADRRLVSAELRAFPLGVDLAAGDDRIGQRVIFQTVGEVGGPGRDVGDRRLDVIGQAIPVPVLPLVLFPVNE